jgi:hypothetical protein
MNKKRFFLFSLCILIILGSVILLIAQGRRHTEEIVLEKQPEKVATVTLKPEEVSKPDMFTEGDIQEPGKSGPSESSEQADPDPSLSKPKLKIKVPNPAKVLKESILNSTYGQIPVDELLDMALKTYDPSRIEMRLALLVRKETSLPLIKQQLQKSQDDSNLYNILMLVQGQLRWVELTPAVLDILNDPGFSERVHGRAATAAALFQAHEAIPAIRELLRTAEDLQARQWAAMALGSLQDVESRYLVEDLLYDDSPYGRVTAAAVLGRLDNNLGEQVALELSYEQNFGIRSRAAEALSLIDTPDARERLEEMRTEDPSINVRHETAEYMGRTELDRLPESEAIVRLENLLTQEHPPRWAFVYLAQNFGYDAVELLEDLANQPGPLSYAAAVAILEIESEVVMYHR